MIFYTYNYIIIVLLLQYIILLVTTDIANNIRLILVDKNTMFYFKPISLVIVLWIIIQHRFCFYNIFNIPFNILSISSIIWILL